MPEPVRGSITDPDFRQRRAQHAARARTTLDHHVAQVVERAPDLTDDHVDRLRSLLPPVRQVVPDDVT